MAGNLRSGAPGFPIVETTARPGQRALMRRRVMMD